MMMMKPRTKVPFFALVTLLAVLVAPSASATPLAPGGTVVPTALLTAPGTLLASTTVNVISSTGAKDFTATIRAAVFRTASGMLDFYYQVVNTSTSKKAASLSRLTTSLFDKFKTDLFFRTDGGSLGTIFANGTRNAFTADRQGGPKDDEVVGFNFGPTTATKLKPKETSLVFVIRTNAHDYTSGFSSVMNGGVATAITFAPVPEPGTLLLLGGGLLLGLAAARRRRPA